MDLGFRKRPSRIAERHFVERKWKLGLEAVFNCTLGFLKISLVYLTVNIQSISNWDEILVCFFRNKKAVFSDRSIRKVSGL